MPSALVEALAGDLADRPWLTPRCLTWAVLAVDLDRAATIGITPSEDDFVPSAAHLASAAVAVTVYLVLVAWGVTAVGRWSRLTLAVKADAAILRHPKPPLGAGIWDGC